MISVKKTKEAAALASALDAWIERFLWTQPQIEERFNASKHVLEDKKAAFREYYDRLESASYEEWVGEFLLRNKTFQGEILDFVKKKPFSLNFPPPTKILEILTTYRVWVRRATAPKKIGEERLVRVSVAGVHRVHAMRVSPASEKHPRGRAEGIILPGCFPYKLKSTDAKEIVEYLLEYRVADGMQFRGGNRLLLSIDLSGPVTIVRKTVDDILDHFLPRRQKRGGKNQVLKARQDRWKFHLMAYDLDSLKLPHAPLVRLLRGLYSDDLHHLTVSTVRPYIHNIQRLVDGEYKKYL